MWSDVAALALMAGVPLLLAVLGETILERAGMINIGIEGMMLVAALSAVVVARSGGSAWIGIAGGIVGAVAVAVVFGSATIHLRGDQIVTGAAINFVSIGATGVVYRALGGGTFFAAGVPRLAHEVPAVSDIPLLGILFRHDVVVAAAWIAAPLVAALLVWRTRSGLRLRAAGENPRAVEISGHSVAAHQWLGLLSEALLVGIAGSYLALALAPGFAENMVAGRGFIALAIVVFGRWSMRGAVAGVGLFAAATALQYWLQAANSGFPFHLLLALPYVVTLATLALFAGAIRPPAALGMPRE